MSGPSIGQVRLANRLVLAPMAGVTDIVFRRIVKETGCCGLVCTEMISAKAVLYRNQRTLELAGIDPDERPTSLQIFGSEPEVMAEAAASLMVYGPDIIDINMGCPTPKIVANGDGAALMRRPELAAQIVAAVVDAVSVPVTVKMRAGWDLESVNAPQLARRVVDAGAAAVAVHGRTRSQFYTGRADWDVIRRVKEQVSVPVVGNGDVRKADDVRRMLQDTGCDAVMIGRAALGNPWVFCEIAAGLSGQPYKAPTPEQRVDMAVRHLDMLIEAKGERTALPQMRKHLAWYLKGLPSAARMRERLFRLTTRDQVVAALQEYRRSLASS